MIGIVSFLSVDQIDDKKSVKESFLARLQDDSAAVVKLLLKEPQVLLRIGSVY